MRRLLLLMVMAIFGGSVLVAGPAGYARANGVPQLVKLTYLAGVSNWGPQDAEGVLEFSFAEAYARVDVKNLVPAAGMTYEGWLVTPGGDTLLVGQISITPDGVGALDAKLTGLNRYDYSLFVITGRATNSTAGVLPAQKSIAGRFAVVNGSAAGQAGDTRPSTLPNTGEKPAPSVWARLFPTVVATVAASVLGGLWYRWNRGRKDQ
jgi:hypothetical protein